MGTVLWGYLTTVPLKKVKNQSKLELISTESQNSLFPHSNK